MVGHALSAVGGLERSLTLFDVGQSCAPAFDGVRGPLGTPASVAAAMAWASWSISVTVARAVEHTETPVVVEGDDAVADLVVAIASRQRGPVRAPAVASRWRARSLMSSTSLRRAASINPAAGPSLR